MFAFDNVIRVLAAGMPYLIVQAHPSADIPLQQVKRTTIT
jgi:hypothetical protein